MQVDIQSRHFSLTSAIEAYIRRRLDYGFSARAHHVKCIVVRLKDVNGPKGGVDKCCQLQIVLAGLPDIVVEDTETSLYLAIDRAVDRASRSLARKLDRRRTRALQSGLNGARASA